MAPNLQKFCRALAQAKVIAPGELEKHYRTWRSSEPDARDNLPSFVKSLVRTGQVTEEQVAMFFKEASTAAANIPTANPMDVELVLVPDPQRRLNRRDLLWALAGAGVATAFIIPLMLLIRPNK